ncbi:hypothetical protein JHK87_038526 [Glycine soja]|nr:hypothetical protein JHK87_038526 [Glycine soja]
MEHIFSSVVTPEGWNSWTFPGGDKFIQNANEARKYVNGELCDGKEIPGFRPGKKVPESILISYVGSQNVQKATIESILRRTLSHAMTSVTGRALQESVRIVTKFSEMEETYSSLGSLG